MAKDWYTSREWALDLWDFGFSVVLVPLKKKWPSVPWKPFQETRASRQQVEAWYEHGEHNIAVLTGEPAGLVVVDGDSAEAVGLITTRCAPTPLVVRTSKGAHFYFRHPGGGRIQNAVRVVDDPPVDLRADGGLVIGPGSVHASGHRYLPVDDLASIRDLPLYSREWFPVPVLETTQSRNHVIFAVGEGREETFAQARGYTASVPGAIQGDGGDVHTYKLACKLIRGWALTDSEALELMLEWNARCVPPWREEDLAAKIRHARAYGLGGYGSFLNRRAVGQTGVLIRGWEP